MFVQAQVQLEYFEAKPILVSPFPDDQEIGKNAKFQMLRQTLTTAQLSKFPRHAFCCGCPCQTRRGWNQRQSSPRDTSQSCHPQPHHFLHMLLLIMKELSCSLYPITLWLSVGGSPEKILWINPYRKPKFTPQTVSFTLRCKELKQ